MSKKKKSNRKKPSSTEYILLAVAILNLVAAAVKLIAQLTG